MATKKKAVQANRTLADALAYLESLTDDVVVNVASSAVALVLQKDPGAPLLLRR